MNTINQLACFVLIAGFIFDVFFDPKNGGGLFYQNISCFSVDYVALYPTRYNYDAGYDCEIILHISLNYIMIKSLFLNIQFISTNHNLQFNYNHAHFSLSVLFSSQRLLKNRIPCSKI
jgi:hypothetical protein